jgi:hypothetical protein
MITMGKLPLSVRARAAISFAISEASASPDEIVTPIHVLLAVCRASPCVATMVLRNLGVSPILVCKRTLTLLGRDPWPWLREHPEVW